MSIRVVISRQQQSKRMYVALYINLALSSRADCKAEGCGRNHASTTLRKLNAKVPLDDTTSSTRAVYQP